MTAAPAPAFDAATAPHRRELHVHCYRMLASFHDAEDAVQETYLRAWRAWDSFDGRHPRAWLYRIATNVCTDLARARARRAPERPTDIAAAADQLTAAGVEHSGMVHFADGAQQPGRDPQDADFGTFVFFDDPDGNTWSVQQGRR